MLKSATLVSGASHTSDSPVSAVVNSAANPVENRTGGRTASDSPSLPAPSYLSDYAPSNLADSAAPISGSAAVAFPIPGATPAFPETDNKPGFGGGCRRGIETLSAYLDGELDSDSQTEVANHLNNCPQCADAFDALLATDRMIQREWRNAPLPSASEMRFALDSIMDALPPVPAAPPVFAPRRVHARFRWMRFATGIASIIALLGLLWSTYRFGFAQGRSSLSMPFAPRRQSRIENLKVLLKAAAVPKTDYGSARFVGAAPCLSGLFPRAESLQFVR